MRGVSLGADHTDNWIGRLQAEYAKSEATTAQSWQLADWFIKSIDPLLIIRGNHDAWSGHGDPLKYIRGVGNLYEKWKALVELRWPNGRKAVLDICSRSCWYLTIPSFAWPSEASTVQPLWS